MSMHENVKPGIYLDEATDDIWRKDGVLGYWTVNGQVWKPFPKALTHLQTVVSGPAVSIADATQEPAIVEAPSKVEDIAFDSYAVAQEVLDALLETIVRYGFASVSDLHDLTGFKTTFKDSRWGWTKLGEAHIKRTGSGYTLNLPEPESV